MNVIQRYLGWMILAGLAWASMGCISDGLQTEDLYPEATDFEIAEGAAIEDEPDVREVIDVLYQYREALVAKDFGMLNRLVSEHYYDNAGTTHTTADDYGHDELPEIFELMAEYADQIQYHVIVQDVVIDGNRAHIDYEFEYAYQYQVADQEAWDAGVDVNRLEMHREGDQWRITSGM